MGRSASEQDQTLRCEIWRALYDLFLTEHERNLASAAKRGVTPGDLKALMRLAPGRTASMRELAQTWRCDASTVTWIVDRLESQGLAERQTHDSDLRVKVVALTEQGEKLRAQLLDELYEPPAALSELSRTDLRALHHLATRLSAQENPGDTERQRGRM